jgi:hypothetical protein
MVRLLGIRPLLVLAALMAVLSPMRTIAQDDPNETPLGDVARNLRKNAAKPAKQVIDDDNIDQALADAEKRKSLGSSLKYLMAGDSKGFQVSAPDVTCSLAFTANVKSLLSANQYSQMDLPTDQLSKLEGPAAIEGDALTITAFNATTWHVSEIAVAFTVVKKAKADAPQDDLASAMQEVRPERKPDVTVIYRMRAAAPPWERVVFSAPLNLDIAPGDEWHWAIVQAKGYPPQGSAIAAATAPATGPTVTPVVSTQGPHDDAAAPASQPQ